MTEIAISFESDETGFTSRACPACGGRFKVHGGEVQLGFCPFCGHEGDRWETPEQLEYGIAFAKKKLLGPELEKLDRSFRDLERSSSRLFSVKVTGRMPDLRVPPKPVESGLDLPGRTTFACCGETIGHAAEERPSHCITCGGRVDRS